MSNYCVFADSSSSLATQGGSSRDDKVFSPPAGESCVLMRLGRLGLKEG